MTVAAARPLRAIAAALAFASLVVPPPAAAAGGGGHGGGGRGGGFGGSSIFHARSPGASARPGAFDGARSPGPGADRDGAPSAMGRGSAGIGRGVATGPRVGARRAFARRSRLALRRLFGRELRIRTSHCDRDLADRSRAARGCDSSRVYGRDR